MIPWSSFTDTEPHYTDEQFPLRESILSSHFFDTATRVSEYEECPMLNNACERRFALGQLDQSWEDFNAGHVDDIESTIDHLLTYYNLHPPFDSLACPPASPCRNDLAGLTDMAPSAVDVPDLFLDTTLSDWATPRGNRTKPSVPPADTMADLVSESAMLSSSSTPPTPTPASRNRLPISCLVNAEPHQYANTRSPARSPAHIGAEMIISGGSSSSTSYISDQIPSLPPLRLTIDNKQCSVLDEQLLSMTDGVNAILSQMLPPATSHSNNSLSDLSAPQLSLKSPCLPQTTISRAPRARIYRKVRKRRQSPSRGLKGQPASSKAVKATKTLENICLGASSIDHRMNDSR